MRIDGDVAGQQGIRFNIFQLFSTYYGEDARLNIGPKGFTGEKYGGATYWDTEAYCLPMYTAIAGEEVAQNLLKYRWLQIDGAYHNAREQGLPGALYPMVTFTGIECHNEWEITFEEIHRNNAIAYAIYAYTPVHRRPQLPRSVRHRRAAGHRAVLGGARALLQARGAIHDPRRDRPERIRKQRQQQLVHQPHRPPGSWPTPPSS